MKRRWSVLTRFSIFPEASTRSSGNHSILSRWLLAALAVTTFHRNFYQAWKSESEKNFFFRTLACRWQLSAWIYAKPGKGNSQMWKWKWKVKWILSIWPAGDNFPRKFMQNLERAALKWSILLNLVSWISFSSDVCLAYLLPYLL